MPGDLHSSDNVVLSPGIRRGVVAVSIVGVLSVISYLTSPNTGRDLGTALAIVLVDVAVVGVMLALRWFAVRPRR